MSPRKTNAQLLEEIEALQARISELEGCESRLRRAEEEYHTACQLLTSHAYCVRVGPDQSLELEWFIGDCRPILGYAREELTELGDWLRLIHPEDLPRLKPRGLRLLAGEPVVDEFRAFNKQGEVRWIRDHGVPIWDEAHRRVVRVIGATQDITEEKRAKERLKAQQGLLSHILSSIPHAVFWKDRRSVYLGCNKKFLEYTGLEKPSDVIGKTDYDLPWRKKESDYYRQCDLKVMETEDPLLEYEETQLGAGGRQATVLTSKVPLRDENGQVFGVLGVYTDITEQKQDQEVLRQSEERFRTLAETVPTAIYIFQGTRIRYVNPAAERLSGYSREELCQMHFWEMIHPEFQSQVKKRGLARQRGEVLPPKYEVKIVTKDGKERWVETTVSLSTYDGKPAVLASSFDITERKQAQDVLRQSEERFRTLAETVPVAVCISQGTEVRYVNPALERLTGYSREELHRMNFWATIDPESQLMVKERGLARERGENVPSEYEVKILTKQGQERWLEGHFSQIQYEGRAAVLASAFDITERKRVQEETKGFARLATRLAASSTVENMLAAVREESDYLLGWDAHYLAVRRPGESTFRVAYLIDTIQGKKQEFTPAQWEIDQLDPQTQPILRGKPVLINREPESAGPPLTRFGDGSRPSASLMFAPVRSGDHIIGDISVQSYTPGRYTEADLEVLQRIADTVAPALERAFAEEARRESDARAKAQFKGVPVPTYIWQRMGDDFQLVDYNDAALEITRGGIARFLGMRAKEHYADRPEIIEEMLRCITEKTVLRREMPYRFKTTGEDKHLAVVYAFVPPDLVLVHTQDITERKHAEEALRESEERYRMLFEEANDAIYVTTREGRILEVNDSMVNLLGYTREELLATNVRNTYANPNDRPKLLREIERKGFLRDYELSLRRKDGTVLNCQLSSRVKQANDGTVLGYHGIIRDVTEKKRTEQEIQRLDQTRREFVANASHEFKTPLTAIRGFAETLLSGTLEKPEDYRYFLKIIHDNALRLERLTDDLAKISLMDEGRLIQQFSDVSVCDFIRSCVETARLKAEQNGITLQVNCPKQLPLVRGDLARLREVLQNLLDNAIQYTPAGGHITVQAARARDRWVAVSVADTGIGIPKDKQSRIFERFYRVDSSRSRKVGGTGLGLSIVKNLVEAHGGHIEVESEPGQGSTFSVFLPQIAEPTAQALERSRRRGRTPTTEAPERILSEEEPGSYYSDQSRS